MSFLLWSIVVASVLYAIRYIEGLESRITELETDVLRAHASLKNIDRFILESKALADDRASYNGQEHLSKSRDVLPPSGLSGEHHATFYDHLAYDKQWAVETPLQPDYGAHYMNDQARKKLKQAMRPLLEQLAASKQELAWLEKTPSPEDFYRWIVPALESKYLESDEPPALCALKRLDTRIWLYETNPEWSPSEGPHA